MAKHVDMASMMLGSIFLFIFLMAQSFGFSQNSQQEKIINKANADHIFNLTKPEWEEYAKKFTAPPGWELRLLPHDTGTSIGAMGLSNGWGLSTQLLYSDNKSNPDMIIVSSIYPVGTMPLFTKTLKKSLKTEAEEELGAGYSVSTIYKIVGNFEHVVLLVSKAI